MYEKMDEEEEEEEQEEKKKKKKRITPSLSLSKNRRCDHWDDRVPMDDGALMQMQMRPQTD